ncbi:protein NPAT isoform X2 [Erpetoichthys calabaricus]|uniref:protein NPAT isoform X2 n=1 Tax=Erpetoichthys calabaricus TaxID=27687 RepID=UPI0022349469|nr:protein NPAT isoform X2 [Erpetoichthys calabaricus]
MLLPSDIARLVLGYLQQEKLMNTCRAFILESPNLKEYAEHSTEDGSIPACVFSLFGKTLTAILNEYIIIKAKDSSQEIQVPVIMASLWKKLEFTLNQIKSMQNSQSFVANQKIRTRNAIAEMRRQQVRSSSQPTQCPMVILGSSDLGQNATTSLSSSSRILGNSSLVTYGSPVSQTVNYDRNQAINQDHGRPVANINRESPLQVVVADRRFSSGLLSPGRRKCESPRRRNTVLAGPNIPPKITPSSVVQLTEQEVDTVQEIIGENFPQMVIENAREKILSDKSLQEKLAENINMFLGSETNIQQISKQSTSSALVPDQSIDEILGLQGEIHMTDEAIHDILERTESDPAFQALFDLFDNGKSKNSDDDSQEQSNVTCQDNMVPLDSTERSKEPLENTSEARGQGTSIENKGLEMDNTLSKTKAIQENKSRKSGRKSSNLLPVVSKELKCPDESDEYLPSDKFTSSDKDGTFGSLCATSSEKEALLSTISVQINESLNTSLSTVDKEVSSTLNVQNECEMETDQPALDPCQLEELPPDTVQDSGTLTANIKSPNKKLDTAVATETSIQLSQCDTTQGSVYVDPKESNEQRTETADSTQKAIENCQQPEIIIQQFQGFQISNCLLTTLQPSSTIETHKTPSDVVAKNIMSPPAVKQKRKPAILRRGGSSPSSLKGTPNKKTSADSSSEAESSKTECMPNSVETVYPTSFESSTTLNTALQLPAGLTWLHKDGTSSSSEPGFDSNIVSLKIIISDEQKDSSSDSELSHAVSSITEDRIPTIILSSPAKSPEKASLAVSSDMNSDETVLAVTCLQNEENASTLESSSQMAKSDDHILGIQTLNVDNSVQLSLPSSADVVQEGGFIQLLPTSTTYGGSSNYIIVANQATIGNSVKQTHPIGQVTPAPHNLNSPLGSRSIVSVGQTVPHSYGPVQPVLQSVMFPVSVVGQNSTTTFPVSTNQVFHVPVGSTLPTTAKLPIPAKPRQIALKSSSDTRKSSNVGSGSEKSANVSSIPKQRSTVMQTSGTEEQQKPSVVPSVTVSSASSSSLKTSLSHKRVLCFDNISTSKSLNTSVSSSQTSESKALMVEAPSLTVSSTTVESEKTCQNSHSIPNISVKKDQTQKTGTGGDSRTTEQTGISGGHLGKAKLSDGQDQVNQREKFSASESVHKITVLESKNDSDVRKSCDSVSSKDRSKDTESRRDQEKRRKSTSSVNKKNETPVHTAKTDIHQKDKFTPSDHKEKHSGSGKDIDERRRSEMAESRASKSKEVRTDKKSSLEDAANVTANKENELEPEQSKQRAQENAPTNSQNDKPSVSSNISLQVPEEQRLKIRRGKGVSPLTKQAAEILQDIQGHVPGSPPSNKLILSGSELPIPQTPGSGKHIEDPLDCPKTPVRRRINKEGELTPRHLPPPATPDLPTCSPVSETGSENSINMAAHTLMILSRAAIARTGTPLKDSVQQTGKISQNNKNLGKKRKLSEEQKSPPSKKDQQRSVSPARKKKTKKQKKLLDSFPDGMDVDKFLSSLHYDE